MVKKEHNEKHGAGDCFSINAKIGNSNNPLKRNKMFLDTVMWLISMAAFLAWIFGITLKNTFATNAKHFALFLLVHLMLSGAAIMLKKHGVAGVSRDSGPWVFTGFRLFLKCYMAFAMIITVSFFFALISKGAQQMAHFHKTYNAANLHRNPLKFYLRREAGIVWAYGLCFLAGGVYVLWAIWFRLAF
ncbi:hypothetical protein [Kosakonia sacchari]|uniref:hypothetical protein n=1 Tax=Kosakonia sacchari TaxID=1158459 RepID=UPI000BE62A87|nr:hypothetical protein [Kosakonia sacchari]PDO85369.1 hypothetical protein BK797_12520 [Kosakonia sacchari]